ncbi:hypothetical protein V1477_019072 [Vespula maculifrons]|uniref:Uncharacterized protein n=1 Tax=Vespula maculifrons TaxID=7453 RepID=A0ABD2ATM3_VESMC
MSDSIKKIEKISRTLSSYLGLKIITETQLNFKYTFSLRHVSYLKEIYSYFTIAIQMVQQLWQTNFLIF